MSSSTANIGGALHVSEVKIISSSKQLKREQTLGEKTFQREQARDKGLIHLEELNPDIDGDGNVTEHENKIFNVLKNADRNGDGKLSINELYTALQGYANIERKSARRKRILAVAIGLVVLMLLANFGLMTAVVYLSKETKVSAEGLLTTLDGHVVRTASAETSVSASGDLLTNDGQHVRTSQAVEEMPLDSRLPDVVLAELKYIHVRSPSGGSMHMFILSFSRVVSEDALFGSYVHIHGASGDIYLDGNIMTFADGLQSMFSKAGFQVVPNQRRLQGAFDMIGLFNSIPAFDGWNATYDEPPLIPTTFEARLDVLHACTYEDSLGNVEDLCDTFEVKSKYRMTHRGEEWARTELNMWSDAAAGLVRESFSSMPWLWGWSLEHVRDRSSGRRYTAQIWNGAKVCRTGENTSPSAPVHRALALGWQQSCRPTDAVAILRNSESPLPSPSPHPPLTLLSRSHPFPHSHQPLCHRHQRDVLLRHA